MDVSIINQLVYIVCNLIAVMVVFTVSGFTEAVSSYCLGDKTAKREGFLSLNPMAHLDPIGLMVLVLCMATVAFLIPEEFARPSFFALLIFLSVQWAYEVPVNTNYFAWPRLGIVLISLAEIIGMYLCSLMALLLLIALPTSWMGPFAGVFKVICLRVAQLSIWFGIISCIPLPPFRAFSIVVEFAPLSWYSFLDWLQEHSFFIRLVLFFIPGISFVFIYIVDFIQSVVLINSLSNAEWLLSLLGY